MSGIKQPVTQVRLTNVAVVRLKLHGIRFEIACYKNKVVSWRSGAETDIDEVLQSPHIFANVSKGVQAKDEDLVKAFATNDRTVIAKTILDKGEIQVSEKERAATLAAQFKDIAVLVSEMTVNPATGRPYPVRMIESGMRACHVSINVTKSTKSQALALIKALKTVMPIERAAMRIAVTVHIADLSVSAVKAVIHELAISIEEQSENANQYRATLLIEPGDYRECEESIQKASSGKAKCEIVDLKVYGEHGGNDSDDDEKRDSDDDSEDDEETIEIPKATKKLAKPPVSAPKPAPGPAPKPKKARRRDQGEEEIRTVGDRPEYAEAEEEIEDASQIRQQQQQQARKAKKERKQKPGRQDKEHEHSDDDGKDRPRGQSELASVDGNEKNHDNLEEWGTKPKAAKSKSKRKPKPRPADGGGGAVAANDGEQSDD